jgi:hypothetical protein
MVVLAMAVVHWRALARRADDGSCFKPAPVS